jgi:hypothetical protein
MGLLLDYSADKPQTKSTALVEIITMLPPTVTTRLRRVSRLCFFHYTKSRCSWPRAQMKVFVTLPLGRI